MNDMQRRLGQQLGNYRLTRFIGQGGFADVYLGEHVYLSTQAAIKVLQARLGPNDLQAFQTEARTIAHLKHPNIIGVLEFGEQQGTPYLVMELALGGTLRNRHPKGARLSLNECLSYAKPIASALQYAHDRKIVHRDIKPENMLVGQSGDILLSDFGIAVVSQSSRYHNPQQDIGGTAAYMASEQLNGKAVPASDQYALGIVLYEWLSGTLPFTGTFTEICSQHFFTAPPSLCQRVPQLPPAIEEVIFRALAKKPEERFPTVMAFVAALEAAVQRFPPTFTSTTSNISQSNQSTWVKEPVVGQRSDAAVSISNRIPSEMYGTTFVKPSNEQGMMPPSAPNSPYPSGTPSQANYAGPASGMLSQANYVGPASGMLSQANYVNPGLGNAPSMHYNSSTNMQPPPPFNTPPLQPKKSKAPIAIIALLVCIILIMGTAGVYILNAKKTGGNSTTGSSTAQTSTTGNPANSQQATPTQAATATPINAPTQVAALLPTSTPLTTSAGQTVALNRNLTCTSGACALKIAITTATLNADANQMLVSLVIKSVTLSGNFYFNQLNFQDPTGQTYQPQGQIVPGGNISIAQGGTVTPVAAYTFVPSAHTTYTLKTIIVISNIGSDQYYQDEEFTFQ